MQERIQQLHTSVVAKLRSTVSVQHLPHAVQELVSNSIDAGAASITVTVNFGQQSAKVEDNGCGIPAEDWQELGNRYCTSKLQSAPQLEAGIKTFGFRGEALASIAAISVLEVTSKPRGSFETRIVVLRAGQVLKQGLALHQRHTQGTIVTIKDFMFNEPVRRRQAATKGAKQMHQECRERLLRLLLPYPDVSLTVDDTQTGSTLLRLCKNRSLLDMAEVMLGTRSCNVLPVSWSSKHLTVSGCISSLAEGSAVAKRSQLLYLNQHLVGLKAVTELVNSLYVQCSSQVVSDSAYKRPAYIIQVACPASWYTAPIDADKTLVAFKELDVLLEGVSKAVCEAWAVQLPNAVSTSVATSQPSLQAAKASKRSSTHPGVHCARVATGERSSAPVYGSKQNTDKSFHSGAHDSTAGQGTRAINPERGYSSAKVRYPFASPQLAQRHSDAKGPSSAGKESQVPEETVACKRAPACAAPATENFMNALLQHEEERSLAGLVFAHNLPAPSQHASPVSAIKPPDAHLERHHVSRASGPRKRRRAASAPPQPRQRHKAVHTNPKTSFASGFAAHVASASPPGVSNRGSDPPLPDRNGNTVAGICSRLHGKQSVQPAPKPLVHATRGTHTDAKSSHPVQTTEPQELAQTVQSQDSREPRAPHTTVSDADTNHSLAADAAQPPDEHLGIAPLPNTISPSVLRTPTPQPIAPPLAGKGTFANDGSCSRAALVEELWSSWRPACVAPGTGKAVIDLAGLAIGAIHAVVPDLTREDLSQAAILRQVERKFIVAVCGSTLAVFDQHAADERVRLERLRKQVLTEATGIASDALDSPVVVELAGSDLHMLEVNKSTIEHWGWRWVEASEQSLTLTHVPNLLGTLLGTTELKLYLQQLDETQSASAPPPGVVRVLKSKACRSAIMFGDALLRTECKDLVAQLQQTQLCFICAHGRPTMAPLLGLPQLHQLRATRRRLTSPGSSQQGSSAQTSNSRLYQKLQRLVT